MVSSIFDIYVLLTSLEKRLTCIHLHVLHKRRGSRGVTRRSEDWLFSCIYTTTNIDIVISRNLSQWWDSVNTNSITSSCVNSYILVRSLKTCLFLSFFIISRAFCTLQREREYKIMTNSTYHSVLIFSKCCLLLKCLSINTNL